MVQYLDNNSGFNQWKSMQTSKSKPRFGFWFWMIIFLFTWWLTGIWFKPQNTVIDNQNVVNIEKTSVAKRQIDAEKISFDLCRRLDSWNDGAQLFGHIFCLD